MSIFFFNQKTAYEMRISDWSSDVCSSDLGAASARRAEEMRFDQRKVVFLLHPLHQHRTDHAAPTDQTYLLHVSLTPWEWRARSGVHRDENQKTEPAEKRADRRVDAETHITELDLQNRGLGVDARDRKSGVKGKGGAVRVELG